ncbi:lamin tail domain-containing protein [Heyndrickxia sporothermodurans]|nr:lamin tail domain-containing protein [Heyndrickxia sporothermodurans]MBL5832610.1 lamin tail domain-containing protein [Heyndrickxia sporothermodurans]MBL5865961.1 lamin tail domain-containing protein [Heyndrickxia sporothermodurans]MED3650379.1 lamin tail domain-containing protein [Heyndrickxia sporothermodurans]MED3655163.1 lamin tail domain-containing protein [Heyndrickxia sporothermodurans]MED3698577.1 lamin tail domain-containing protein [Heyndrickxia sporothermodurans]
MKKSCKWMIYALAIVLVIGNVFVFHSSESNASENVTPPKLLITEVVPDTDNYAGLDAFEFVEIYNNSNEEIDLKGYRVQSGNWNVTIDHSIKVAPWESIVFWTRRTEIQPLTIEAFNRNYFASYQSKYLEENSLQILNDIGGLVNSKTQTVTVSDPDGKEIVRATYSGDDVYTNKSITFSYPQDGSIAMTKISGNQNPTPGWLITKQAPPRPITDKVAPFIPANIKSVIGNGTISLTWDPNTESDIYRYNIYKNGNLEFSVSPDKHEFTLYSLTGNQNYTLQMTAEDLSGNESVKSVPILATPKHQLITQVDRSSNDRDPKYGELWRISQDGPIIPGLVQDLVPQGLGYYKKKNWLLTINYLSDGRPGTLCVIDATTEKLIKSVVLYNQNGTPYTGHAGGVAVSKENVWIASENFLFTLNINDIVSARDNDEIRFTNQIPVPVEAAYDVYDDDNGILWVGEFYEPNSYPTDPSHHQVNRGGEMQYAWMVGYKLKSNTDMIAEDQWIKGSNQSATPDYVLSTIGKVQGAVVEKKGISLVTSYGRANDSVLYRYESPLKEEPHKFVTIGGKEIPLWFLDGETAKPRKSITAIPMKEGAVLVKKQLYVSFESGANKYRYTGTYPRDRMLKIDMKTLMKDDKEIIKEEGND